MDGFMERVGRDNPEFLAASIVRACVPPPKEPEPAPVAAGTFITSVEIVQLPFSVVHHVHSIRLSHGVRARPPLALDSRAPGEGGHDCKTPSTPRCLPRASPPSA